VEFLEEYLAKSRRAYLVVTHDRRFLDRVAEEIVDLENGRLTGYSGGYTSYKTQKAERILSETRAFEKQQDFIDKEQEYIRRNIAGVNSRQAKGRRTKLARVDRLEKPTGDVTNVDFQFDTAKVGGRIFLRAKDVDAGYAAGAPIVRGVNFELLRGERLAILGENGTGKTTLLKTLAGRLPALAGTVTPGHDVSIGYYDQELRDLDPKRRAIDAVWDQHPDETEGAIRSYLARFAFRGDDVFADISGLSGGEKGRLTLAVVMKQRHNLLLLDEPTNHLDLDSREALEDSLDDFPGSIVFVSHDRAFIDRLATRVIDLRDGRPMLLPGNYTETADARTERRKRPEPAPARRAEAVPAAAPARPSDPAPAAPEKPRPARRADASDDKEATRKRRRIKTLEEKIAALENEIESIETRLWEEALTLGPVAAHELSKQKLAKKEELDLLVEEWAKLSEEADQAAPRTP
jgi:ATP-binding cassette subfamily F protein 3